MRSRALERGQSASEASGYQARLQGFEKRGEVDTMEGGWTRALAGEGLVHDELDQLPIWMGISVEVRAPPGLTEDTESSHSRGSFELLEEPA